MAAKSSSSSAARRTRIGPVGSCALPTPRPRPSSRICEVDSCRQKCPLSCSAVGTAKTMRPNLIYGEPFLLQNALICRQRQKVYELRRPDQLKDQFRGRFIGGEASGIHRDLLSIEFAGNDSFHEFKVHGSAICEFCLVVDPLPEL